MDSTCRTHVRDAHFIQNLSWKAEGKKPGGTPTRR